MRIPNTLIGISLLAMASGISATHAEDFHNGLDKSPVRDNTNLEPPGMWLPNPVQHGWPHMDSDITATNFVVADQCSGTLISLKYKLVLTNNHCLEGYIDKVEKDETSPSGKVEKITREVFKDMELKQKIYKDFELAGSASLQAKIVAHVIKYDLALLQIKADTIPQTVYSHVLPKEEVVQRGDPVFVVGNPYMLDANLTRGIISSTNRILHWEEDDEDVPYYGVDAAINPGNSGGALYNADGQLIGVPGATIRNATGLGFAIPVTLIRKFLTENCYEDVWNAKAEKDHAACKKDKLDEQNKVREKAGLPAIKPEDEEKDRLEEGAPVRAMTLQVKKPSALDTLFQFAQ